MTELNWKHYELRVVHAIERSDEFLAAERGVPLEELVVALAKEDGVTTDLAMGEDNFARYMRMVYALATHEKVELVARPREDDPYPNWEVWLPSEPEEPKFLGKFSSRDLLMAIVPVLSGALATALTRPQMPQFPCPCGGPLPRPVVRPPVAYYEPVGVAVPSAAPKPAVDIVAQALDAVNALSPEDKQQLVDAGVIRIGKDGKAELVNGIYAPSADSVVTPPPADKEEPA